MIKNVQKQQNVSAQIELFLLFHDFLWKKGRIQKEQQVFYHMTTLSALLLSHLILQINNTNKIVLPKGCRLNSHSTENQRGCVTRILQF